MPAGAVTFRSIDSPFFPGPVTPESPGRSTDGGVAWPTPFSRNGNFGGASLFGSAPCAFAELVADLAVDDRERRLRLVLLGDDRERVRAFAGRHVHDVQRPAGGDV